eukprot:TRINITY_DN5800_c0_g1_i3.p1 TRINITY_DN5800_c0_g1~~TRINITY_DN5800_c0_g1_i3.p1  ORF type:complete len:109 (+),score=21.88 TRINITY_DN5800_c0_g1_i3:308-634(+)
MGLVSGSSVHARSFLHDLYSRVVGFFGGEVPTYSLLMERATMESTANLMDMAKKKGADAVINVRIDNSATSDPTSGVFFYSHAYGTAVKLEKYQIDTTEQFPKFKQTT